MSATSTVQSLTHFPCLQSRATAIIQSPTNNCPFFVAFQLSVVWWFFFSCIVLEAASLGNWESQTADETSPREPSPPWFRALAKSHVDDLTYAPALMHSPLFYASRTHAQLISRQTACQARRHTSLSNQAVSCKLPA